MEKKAFRHFSMRAALLLALMLTATTGWAAEVLRGGTENAPVAITTTAEIISTKNGTSVGYFVVNENTTITHQVRVGYSGNSNIYISIPTGKTLTVEVTGGDPGLRYWTGGCALHVYGGGTLVVSNGIETYGGTCDMHNITINGAHYDDDGYLDGSIHTVTFNSKGGTAVASQTFGLKYGQTIATVTEPTAPTRTNYDFGGWYKESSCTNAWDFASDGVTADVTLYAKWTPDPAHFSVNDAGTEYTIHTATGWNVFCDLLADNTKGYFDGKTVALGADITVTRMAGGDSHDFTGTFDGGGHTLTFSHTATDNYCAPFRYVQGASAETPAVIHNLNVVSTVTAADYRHPAGLIALQSGHVSVTDCNVEAHISSTVGTSNPYDLYPAALVSQSNNTGVLTVSGCTTTGQIATDGKFAAGLIGIVQNTATIENCRASVTIQSTTSGDGTHGGLVASQNSGTTITITGCVFDGSLLGSATNKCGGFIGYRKGGAEIYNSLFAPTEVTVQNDGSATFARNKVDTYNSYYTYYLCDGTNYAPYDPADADHPDKYNNGHATRTVAAATDVTISAIALTGDATEYTVSGITAYSGGGLQLGETLYYGSGDAVSLTLSNTATAPLGYQYSGYTTSAGTLSGTTLTMPDEDVTINIDTDHPRSTGQAVPVGYTDADGKSHDASAVALDGTESDLGAYSQETWYFVGIDISHTGEIDCRGNVNIILCDGKTMTANHSNSNGAIWGANGSTIAIYGQTAGTGTLNINSTDCDGIRTSGDIVINGGTVNAILTGTEYHGDNAISVNGSVTINGGTVNATGDYDGIKGGTVTINGGTVNATGGFGSGINAYNGNGTITLGWNKPTDRITASSYSGTVKVADGKSLYNGSEVLSGTITDMSKLNGKTLRPYKTITLADAADNSSAIREWNGSVAEVTLQGRTLTKNNEWNTLCLPFTLTSEQIAASPLAGATIKTMDNTSSGTRLDNDGTLTLNFSTVTAIEAGTPYIIKWTTTGDDIVNPTFSGVTISSTTPTAVVSNDGKVTFVGQYSPFSIVNSGATGDNQGNKNEILLMTKGNKIGYSKNPRTLNCFRCHFYVPTNGGQQAHNIEVDFGEGETTSLSEELRVKSEDVYYTLDGRKLEGKPTAKGMYIVNGRKVIIK